MTVFTPGVSHMKVILLTMGVPVIITVSSSVASHVYVSGEWAVIFAIASKCAISPVSVLESPLIWTHSTG